MFVTTAWLTANNQDSNSHLRLSVQVNGNRILGVHLFKAQADRAAPHAEVTLMFPMPIKVAADDLITMTKDEGTTSVSITAGFTGWEEDA